MSGRGLVVARHNLRHSAELAMIQSSCRNRGLLGESGRDAATKFTFLNSVRSLLTVPVPKLRLELDREDDSLLFVRVLHECSRCHADDEFERAQSWVIHFGRLAMRYQIESPLRFHVVPRLLEVCHSRRICRSHCAASLRQRLQQARERRYPWRTEAVTLSLGRRQFRVRRAIALSVSCTLAPLA